MPVDFTICLRVIDNSWSPNIAQNHDLSANAIIPKELEFGGMDYRTRFKRFCKVFTICWLGVCLIGGIAVSSVPIRGTMVSIASPVAGGWTSYTKDLIKGLTGSEYDAIRSSYFVRNVAAAAWEAKREIASSNLVNFSNDGLTADTDRKGNPERFGFVARLMATGNEEVLMWFAITVIPPIVVYLLGFIAVPKIAGAFKSGE
jgi:hypothetical protein